MTDGAGCKKDFPTNTFYILKKDPVVTVSSDKKVVCNGGDICLYLSVKLDVVEETKKYLPTSFSVNYDFRKADLDRSAVWVYSTPSYLTDINGKVEFTLTDPTTGTYTAIKCFKIPNISPTTH